MGDKGAREVAHALLDGRPYKRGNARTDGTTYYLHGNPIARVVEAPPEVRVKARILGYSPRGHLELSWAGWPTQTTERHINAVCNMFGRVARAWCKGRKDPRPKWRTNDGEYVEADVSAWWRVS